MGEKCCKNRMSAGLLPNCTTCTLATALTRYNSRYHCAETTLLKLYSCKKSKQPMTAVSETELCASKQGEGDDPATPGNKAAHQSHQPPHGDPTLNEATCGTLHGVY